MKKLKLNKRKVAALFALAFLSSAPTLESEISAFRLTAPTDALVKISFDYVAKRFAPTPAEAEFIKVAKFP